MNNYRKHNNNRNAPFSIETRSRVVMTMSATTTTTTTTIETDANRNNNKQSHTNSIDNDNNKWKIVRLSEEHVMSITRMCVQEWGPMGPSATNLTNPNHGTTTGATVFTLFPPQITKILPRHVLEWCHYVDNFVLACIVYLGLYQRINRKGGLHEDDYAVFCIVMERNNRSDTNHIDDMVVVGAAEMSFQTLFQSSSPICLPMNIKQAWNSIATTTRTKRQRRTKRDDDDNEDYDDDNLQQLVPYISNVIVDPKFRGQGYGKNLILAVENYTTFSLGFDHVFLHVSREASLAISLYHSLDYREYEKEATSHNVDLSLWWNRFLRFMLGLLFVKEQHFMYMRKKF